MTNKKLRRIKKYINTLRKTRKDWHCGAIYKMRAYAFSQTDTETTIINYKCCTVFFSYKGKEIGRIDF